MTDIAVVAEAVAAAPRDYTIPGAQELLPKTVTASLDGSSAAGPWFPCLQFLDPGGHVMVSCVATSALAAGASADISWFPGAEVEEEGGASPQGVIVETFYVSSVDSTPVTSTTTLQSGRAYLITVQGTFSLRNVALGTGSPQPDAMFPTSTVGRVSLEVGWDAECIFANESGQPLGHDTAFEMDLGDGHGMRHVEPDGGPFATPQTNFFYTYSVTGSGSTIQAKVADSAYTDNYGKLLVTIQTVGGGSSGGGAGSLLPDPSLEPDGEYLRTSSGTAVWQASSGSELDYVTQTTDLTVTATSAGTAQTFIDGNAVTYDGSTRIKLEVWSPNVSVTWNTAGAAAIPELFDGATDLGRFGQMASGSAGQQVTAPYYAVVFLTPSAGAHTYHIKFWKAFAGGDVIVAGDTGGIYESAWYRITVA